MNATELFAVIYSGSTVECTTRSKSKVSVEGKVVGYMGDAVFVEHDGNNFIVRDEHTGLQRLRKGSWWAVDELRFISRPSTCIAQHTDAWVCNRKLHHVGDHVAVRASYTNGRLPLEFCERWFNTTVPQGVMPKKETTLIELKPDIHAEAAIRFLCGLNLQDHPVSEQREREILVQAYMSSKKVD